MDQLQQQQRQQQQKKKLHVQEIEKKVEELFNHIQSASPLSYLL